MKNRGFTIIETLVAIAILMIAIAGPLVIATKGLSAALHAKDQSTATFLAVEGLEILRNVKDTATSNTGIGFDVLFDTASDPPVLNLGKCTISRTCPVGYSPAIVDMRNPPDCNQYYDCLMYQDPNSARAYSYVSIGTPITTQKASIFKRYFYVTKVSDTEFQVTVKVDWNQGTISNSVTLTSTLTETPL